MTSASQIRRVCSLLCVLLVAAQATVAAEPAPTELARGRYLTVIAGCNDCHTPGYDRQGDKIPETAWLTGTPLGWHGPWGTTYAVNVRLYVQKMSEEAWIARWRSNEARPPMPWRSMRAMTDADLRAIYQYARHLGAAGAETPAYVPPEKQPTPPFVQFPSPP
jgi:mono/diheme cytochrome c family protein